MDATALPRGFQRPLGTLCRGPHRALRRALDRALGRGPHRALRRRLGCHSPTTRPAALDMLRLGGGLRRSDVRPAGRRRPGGLGLGGNRWRGRLHLGRALHWGLSGLCTAASDSPLLVDSPRAASAPPPVVVTRTFGAWNKFRLNSAVEGDSVQTLAPSFQSMPALPQSALVSGWLEVSKRRGSPNAPMDGAARAGPAPPSLSE